MKAIFRQIRCALLIVALALIAAPLRTPAQNLNPSDITKTFKVFADTRDDGKLQDLQVTSVTPGSVMDTKYCLKTDDVIIAVIGSPSGRTELNGLKDEQDAEDAICKAVIGGGQLVVERGDQKLI